MPILFRFLWVLQTFKSKLSGSPFPGASACLMKIMFPPDCNLVIISSFEKVDVGKIIDIIRYNIKRRMCF